MMPPQGMMSPEMLPEEESIAQIEQGAANEGVTKENITLNGVSPMSLEGERTNFIISPDQFATVLDEEIIQILETKLTPSMRRALGMMLGPEIESMLQNIGLQEPQHLVPQSVIVNSFPAQTTEESIAMFDQSLIDAGGAPELQQDISGPPVGGLGGMPEGIPQTNVPPVV